MITFSFYNLLLLTPTVTWTRRAYLNAPIVLVPYARYRELQSSTIAESQRPASKRRKRKPSTATTGAGSKKKNMSPGPQQPFMAAPPGGPGSQG